jgi:hypothetical protein
VWECNALRLRGGGSLRQAGDPVRRGARAMPPTMVAADSCSRRIRAKASVRYPGLATFSTTQSFRGTPEPGMAMQ